jgi:hypothetical protein
MDEALQAHILEHTGKEVVRSWLYQLLSQIELACDVHGEREESSKRITITVTID